MNSYEREKSRSFFTFVADIQECIRAVGDPWRDQQRGGKRPWECRGGAGMDASGWRKCEANWSVRLPTAKSLPMTMFDGGMRVWRRCVSAVLAELGRRSQEPVVLRGQNTSLA